jgi:polyphosphate kinase 2 (PPK2 family)
MKIELVKNPPRLADVDMKKLQATKKEFEAELATLQLQMLAVQRAYHRLKRRAILVFEGWDASGKGGSIRRLTEKLDPRGYRVHPIGAPTTEEQGRHYLYRFWRRMPVRGAIAVFDRSWYGRVLVERVEGFAAPAEWERAYDEINRFEGMLLDDHVRVIKFFLHVSPHEQARRFVERLHNPYKRWKLTSEDLRNREKWSAYEKAIDEMLARTSTTRAPWTLVPGDHKWTARLTIIRHVVEELSKGVDLTMPPINPMLKEEAERLLGVSIDEGKPVEHNGKVAKSRKTKGGGAADTRKSTKGKAADKKDKKPKKEKKPKKDAKARPPKKKAPKKKASA